MAINDTGAKAMPPDNEAPTGDTIRRLLRSADRGCLASAQRNREGWPYASLVLVAVDHDASPLLLISRLADHTRNLLHDPRASLLIDATAGLEEPLTGSRVTVMGRLARTAHPRHRARFLARHPGARIYAGFEDFSVWRMAIATGHIVAGFGRIEWIDGGAILGRADTALADREAEIVAHMNDDHGDAVALYARYLLGLEGEGWRMTGCDAEGVDLRLGGRVARLGFDKPAEDGEAARVELVRLAKRARRIADSGCRQASDRSPVAGKPGKR